MADVSRLPGPNSDFWDWQMSAACRGEDPGTFFHPDGERGPARTARERSAKAICARCPIISQCAAHALSVREPYGIWGGMSEEERDAVYRRRIVRAS
jgi:WhiB family redox-sensing transcriptional regulator